MSFNFKQFVVPLQDSLEDMINECQIEPIEIEKPIKPMRKKFIRPIDLEWFLRARAISPMGAVMACFLWYRYGLERASTIKATRHKLSEFSIGKSSSRRLLRQMEEACLVSIKWQKSRAPEVTLLLPDLEN